MAAELIFTLELLDGDDQVITSDLRIRESTVEFWLGATLVGTAVRDHLRAWLRSPFDAYGYDRMTWFYAHQNVGVCVTGFVPGCYLHEQVVQMLKVYI